MELFNGLPVYHLEISDDERHGLTEIALVDAPAIKRDFVKFNEQRQAFSLNEERRIVSGPAMIPDTMMFRNDKNRGQYYVLFTKEAIEKTMLKFFAAGRSNQVNLMHQTGEILPEVVMFESFVVDSSRGVQPMTGYEDCPDGTWFVSYKVNNEEAWKQVKDGTLKGFSIEGLFDHQPVGADEELTDEEAIAEAKNLSARLQKIIKNLS